jgi:hypothetical protein
LELKNTKEVLKKTQSDLAVMIEKERVRLEDLVHVSCQAEPSTKELAIQTEFIVPQMSLRAVIATSKTNNRKKYPIVTPNTSVDPFNYAHVKLINKLSQNSLLTHSTNQRNYFIFVK